MAMMDVDLNAWLLFDHAPRFHGAVEVVSYLGDEDNGAMSAWQIFSSLGFYPLQPGSPTYVIGSPLFNHAKDFPEAIESILSQTYTDFALVLVDDCSTDETPAIAREYETLDAEQRLTGSGHRASSAGSSRKQVARPPTGVR